VRRVLFDDPTVLPVNALLAEFHYLGPTNRGEAYSDKHGVMIFANPNSRRLPQDRWLELVRWCIVNGSGSQQWASARRWLMQKYPHVTTVVSYSDPSVGHDGALYRACNWLWAPTWHRLRTPPSGNGNWGSGQQETKDRWIAALRRDSERANLLAVKDQSVMRRMPWAEYREPTWHGARPTGGGGDYKRWKALQADAA
jgi:hypothetical protein